MDSAKDSAKQIAAFEQSEKVIFKGIVDFMETTDLDFVQIEKGERKIVLRKSFVAAPRVEEAAADATASTEEAVKTQSIRSPIVGRFYRAPGADRPPFVVESGAVTAGQKVAIVEAMKIKKEVFSAYSGRITRVFVRDGDPVEYGQELFAVEPVKE